MDNSETHALERVKREIASLDKNLALVERELPKKLGQEDASRIMDFARAGDEKTLAAIIGRLNDMRGEFREATAHTEQKLEASLFRANTEMESRIMARLDRMTAPDKRFHPIGVAAGGLGGGSVLWLILQAIGIVPGFGG